MTNSPNLSHGRHTLAIPGPSVMPERVLQAMHRPAPNIYTGELIDLTYSLVPDLKAVAKTQGHVAMYIGNGHAAWEASLANVLEVGDKVLVPGAAQFSLGWAETARRRGLLGGATPSTRKRWKTRYVQTAPTTSKRCLLCKRIRRALPNPIWP